MSPSTRRTLIIIGIGLAVTGSGAAAWLRGMLDPVLVPMQRALTVEGDAPDRLRQLDDQVAKLAAENALLRSRLAQYQAVGGESGLAAQVAKTLRGRVIARTQRADRRYVELDVGGIDGVDERMVVADGVNAVGLVVAVQERRCLVQELGDGESRVAAAILGVDGVLAEGVLAGTGDADAHRLEQIEDREGLVIRQGMAVVSAGADQRFPIGMPIGTVRSASKGPGDDHWKITVRPRAGTWPETLLVLKFAPRIQRADE